MIRRCYKCDELIADCRCPGGYEFNYVKSEVDKLKKALVEAAREVHFEIFASPSGRISLPTLEKFVKALKKFEEEK